MTRIVIGRRAAGRAVRNCDRRLESLLRRLQYSEIAVCRGLAHHRTKRKNGPMWSCRSVFAKALIFLAMANWAISTAGPPTGAAVETSIALSCSSLAPQAVRPDPATDQDCLLWHYSESISTEPRRITGADSESQASAVFTGSPLESVKFQV